MGECYSNRTICLALMIEQMTMDEFLSLASEDRNNLPFQVFFPHTGQSRATTFGDLQSTALQIPIDNAKAYWEKLHLFSKNQCQHCWESGRCLMLDCDEGVRICNYTVVSASVLTIWTKLQSLFQNKPCKCIRLTTTDGRRIVGLVIPRATIDIIDKFLTANSLTRNERMSVC